MPRPYSQRPYSPYSYRARLQARSRARQWEGLSLLALSLVAPVVVSMLVYLMLAPIAASVGSAIAAASGLPH